MKIAKFGNLIVCLLFFIATIICLCEEIYSGALFFFSFIITTTFLSLPLYGFGQLVDDIHAMRSHSAELPTQIDELPEL